MVVPTHNRRSLVVRVLEALAEQEAVHISLVQVVVVVDGSSDGTFEQLHAWRAPYEMKVLAQVHAGVSVARNLGWRWATSPLVLFLDDDVVPLRRLLAEHIEAHVREPDTVVLGQVLPGPGGADDAWTWYDGWTMRRKYAALETSELPSGIHFGGNISLLRRRLEEVGGFDSRLPRGEHVDLGYRLSERGATFRYAPAAQAEHHGRRDFEAWLMAYRLDGRMDVALYRDRGYAGGLSTIVASYHDRQWLNRGLLRLGLHSRFLERRLITITSDLGRVAHRLRIRPLARLAMSATANLAYWSGVRDGLRGNHAFWRAVRQTRSHSTRPYRLRGQER